MYVTEELNQNLQAYIKISYVWGFAWSLYWTSVAGFPKYQGTWVLGAGGTISGPRYTPIPRTQPSPGVAAVLTPLLAELA